MIQVKKLLDNTVLCEGKDGSERSDELRISLVIAQSVFAVLIGVVPASAQEKASWLSNFEVASGIDSI
jgi:hypothetical protein